VGMRLISSSGVKFREYLTVFRRQRVMIAVLTILVVAATAIFSYRRTPVYESSAWVIVNPIGSEPASQSGAGDAINMSTQKEIARSLEVAELSAEALNTTASPLELLEKLEVGVRPNSSILVIRYSAATAAAAQKGADAFAAAYLSYRAAQAEKTRDASIKDLTARIELLNARIAEQDGILADPGSSADERAKARVAKSTLEDLKSVDRARLAEVTAWPLDPGSKLRSANLPSAPVSPRHPVDLGIGLIMGLLLAALVALVREHAEHRIGGREAVANILHRPVLAVIPPIRRRRRGKLPWRREPWGLVSLDAPDSPAVESYRILRTRIAQLRAQLDIRTIAVVSAGTGEGKSTTAANLAMVLADSGRQVLLISADLRRPRIHQFFSLSNKSGLSNLLLADRSTSTSHPSAMSPHVAAEMWSVAPNLIVIMSGPPPQDPATLMDSDAMRALLKQQRDLFDLVILDCPSALVVADSLALAPLVDAVVVVADAKSIDRATLNQLRDQLDQVEANVVGVVLNRSKQKPTWSYSQHTRAEAPRATLLREPGKPGTRPDLHAPTELGAPPEPKRFWEPAADTAAARLSIALLSLGCLAAAATAFAVSAHAVRLGALLVFCLLGLGSAPWQMNRTVRLPARLTVTMVTSLAVLTLVSMAMLAVHQWHPVLAFVAVAAASIPLHLAGVLMASRDLERSHWRFPAVGTAVHRRTAPFLGSIPVIGAVAGGALCLGSALTHRHMDPGFFGFLPHIGIAWYAGLALILLAIVLSRSSEEHQLVIPVLLLVLVLTLTPALVYDGPRSQVAAKHVDLIMQIRTLHRLDSAIDIYNSWPGFFTATAWLSDIIGIRDPIHLATFWPPLLGLFRIAALRYMFGQVLPHPRQSWIAITLAVLADPFGADYFSPQSVGFVIGVAVFGLALSRNGDAPRLALIFIAGWVLAMTHQLSPYGVGGTLALLVLFKQIRPWWTPLLVLSPALLWGTIHRGALRGFLSWETIGHFQNFRPPKTTASPALERLPVVGQTVLAMVAGILIVGAVASFALLLHRRELRAWAFACCPAVGLFLVAINPYGQEGIFRAAIFGIPWLALLAGHCFSASGRPVGRLALLAVTATLTGTFLVAAFGLDATNVMRPSDVAAFRYFQQHITGPRQYVLALGAGDLPTSLPPRTGSYQAIRRDRLNQPIRQEPALDPDRQVRTLTTRFLDFSRQPPASAQLYAVWSPVSSYYGWAYGLQSPDEFAALQDAFLRSRYWRVVFHQDGTYLFRFDPRRYSGGRT
jgi:capsular exopolysaccharide synthesis family protein